MCKDCKNYEYIIQELCQDKAFGVLTRNGLEYMAPKLRSFPCGYYIILMDFCNVSKLNERYGYEEVNARFTELFTGFKDENLIGRCFSGDEIIMITLYDGIIRSLKAKGEELNLHLRYAVKTFTGDIGSDLQGMYTILYHHNERSNHEYTLHATQVPGR